MATKKKNTKVGMGAFNVRDMSNAGVKVPLTLPDGTETDEFLIVRGVDSAAIRDASARGNLKRLEIAKVKDMPPEFRAGAEEDITRDVVVSLIAGWSFGTECNEENVDKFLLDAPQILKQVNIFAADRSNFFKKPPQS